MFRQRAELVNPSGCPDALCFLSSGRQRLANSRDRGPLRL